MLTIPFVLLVFAVFVSLSAIICQIAAVPLLRVFARVSPELRAHLLLLLAAAPWIFGLGVLVSSIGDIFFGACDIGNECLWNEDPTLINPVRALLVLPLVLSVLFWAGRILPQILAARRVVGTLDAISLPGEAADLRIVPDDRPLALAGGGKVYVSRLLQERLPPEQYQAVLLHERAHLARHDGLLQTIAAILTAGYLPVLRRRLMAAQALANEQACDQQAAATVGSEVTAAAILAVARLREIAVPHVLLPGFADNLIAERVRHLIQPERPSWNIGLLHGVVALVIVFAFLGADVLYYLGMLILYPTPG